MRKSTSIFLSMFLFVIISCQSSVKTNLLSQLDHKNIADYFMSSGSEELLDSIWKTDGAPEALHEIAVNTEGHEKASFTASEILFYKSYTAYPSSEKFSHLAHIYALALKNKYGRYDNAWGLPGVVESSLVKHVAVFGESSVSEFGLLLDDTTLMGYTGSQEAADANSYSYRTKDIAAYYICKIKNWNYVVSKDPAERDIAIEELKKNFINKNISID